MEDACGPGVRLALRFVDRSEAGGGHSVATASPQPAAARCSAVTRKISGKFV